MTGSKPSTPREDAQTSLLPNGSSNTGTPISSGDQKNYGTAATEAAKKVIGKNLNTPCVDIASLALMSGLCCLHPCASLGFAAAVDTFCAIGRTLCKVEGPRTVYFSDVYDAYHLTREGKDIPALTVLPCGFVGVAAGQFGNLFNRKASEQSSNTVVAPTSPSIQ